MMLSKIPPFAAVSPPGKLWILILSSSPAIFFAGLDEDASIITEVFLLKVTMLR